MRLFFVIVLASLATGVIWVGGSSASSSGHKRVRDDSGNSHHKKVKSSQTPSINDRAEVADPVGNPRALQDLDRDQRFIWRNMTDDEHQKILATVEKPFEGTTKPLISSWFPCLKAASRLTVITFH